MPTNKSNIIAAGSPSEPESVISVANNLAESESSHAGFILNRQVICLPSAVSVELDRATITETYSDPLSDQNEPLLAAQRSSAQPLSDSNWRLAPAMDAPVPTATEWVVITS